MRGWRIICGIHNTFAIISIQDTEYTMMPTSEVSLGGLFIRAVATPPSSSLRMIKAASNPRDAIPRCFRICMLPAQVIVALVFPASTWAEKSEAWQGSGTSDQPY